ncbi:MAG: glutamate--tRNA ligase [Candidatus Diapherotrites archaeon]|nr:glutamate--tRNA ligase [Candidatus Diapherotrites archaeon]
MQSIENAAYKYSIKNAFLHEGKANEVAVVGKLKALFPDSDIKTLSEIAKEAVSKVNAMAFDEIKNEYQKIENIEGYELKPKQKVLGLEDLPWAKKQKVITRFAPNPNGPMHIGNARAAILSHDYARKYDGKFILRFDDTDPKVKKPMPNAEEIFRRDLEWLGCKIDEVYFASDRLEIYKKYMVELIESGRAYVCTCNPEYWRARVKKQLPCPCREKPSKEHMKRFDKMVKNQYKEGEAVIRIKTILSHLDPSVRDWWIAKVVDKPNHPKVKDDQHVWPSYNFASAIDDHLMEVTLIIRGQEHKQNETKQVFLYNYFGWEYPHTIYTGRVMLEGVILSTSKTKAAIEEGLYSGWDDPRLGTIVALRKRGFVPETIRRIIMEIGTKPNDTTVEWDMLTAINRELISEKSPRINTIEKPFKLIVEFPPEKTVKLGENITINLNADLQPFLVDKSAIESTKGIFRLRNAYNVKLKKITEMQAFAEYAGHEKIEPIVPWVLSTIDLYIKMPDGTTIKKFADKSINFKEGETYYIDNLGFVKVDAISENGIMGIFIHR